MTKRKKLDILFAYNCVFDEYKSIKRNREEETIKKLRLEFYKSKLEGLQKIITEDFKINVEFAKL